LHSWSFSSEQAYLADVPASCSQEHTEPTHSLGGRSLDADSCRTGPTRPVTIYRQVSTGRTARTMLNPCPPSGRLPKQEFLGINFWYRYGVTRKSVPERTWNL
jgi:hypothetical protein